MSVDGSGGSAAIFPMICCAKLAGIFENSKNTSKSAVFEKSFEKTLKIRMIFGLIGVEVAQIELKLGWVAGKYVESAIFNGFGSYLAAYLIKKRIKTKKIQHFPGNLIN